MIRKITITPRFVSKYLIFLTIIGLTHHLDHILRFDHSGWPFRQHLAGINDITPFTYSLFVYPVLITWFIVKNKPYRIVSSTIVALLVLVAHIFVELPTHQYLTWANDSSPYGMLVGSHNLLHVHSPLLGALSATLGVVLDITVALLPWVFWKETTRSKTGEPKPPAAVS